MLSGPSANLTLSQLFKRDTQLLARAQNIATSCSTFSMFGRLSSSNLKKRLFVPQCQIKYVLSEKQLKGGRRRSTSWNVLNGGSLHQTLTHPDWQYFSPYIWLPHPSDTTLAIYIGQPFSKDEPLEEIFFYEAMNQGHPITESAIGERVLSLAEWKKLCQIARTNGHQTRYCAKCRSTRQLSVRESPRGK